MTATSQIYRSVIEAARHSAVLVDRSQLGLIKISGDTRLDLINRMSTGAVELLSSGQGAATVLTTDVARIVDRLILYPSSDAVYALTGAANADAVIGYLQRFVFFNDDFHMEDLSADTVVFAVYGPAAAAALASAGFTDTDLPLHYWREEEVAGVVTTIHRTDPIGGDGYFIMSQAADGQKLWSHLVDSGLVVADAAAFDFLRIEAGQPRLAQELTLDYNPLEADLWPDVSFNKGCYIGQEIIARLDSRGRLAKRLTRLAAAGPVTPGTVIQANGKTAGTVTSAAVGPEGVLALGYVKTALLNEGAALHAGAVELRPLAPTPAPP